MGSGSPQGFEFVVRKSGEIVVTHHGLMAATLRDAAADAFLERIAGGDAQAVMARVTGNYKRGNERRRK